MKAPEKGSWQGLVGLAMRSRRLSIGRDAVRKSVGRGEAALVLMTRDAGRSLEDDMVGRAAARGVPIGRTGSRADMGRLLGRNEVSVVSVNDPGLARAVREALPASKEDTDAPDRAHEAEQ